MKRSGGDEHPLENKTIKNWVKSLVENKEFHSFTSKNEIMELINVKLNNLIPNHFLGLGLNIVIN